MYYTVENNQEMNFPLDIYFLIWLEIYLIMKGAVHMFWGLQK